MIIKDKSLGLLKAGDTTRHCVFLKDRYRKLSLLSTTLKSKSVLSPVYNLSKSCTLFRKTSWFWHVNWSLP